MRERDPRTIIEFNGTAVRVCSSVFSRRFKEERLARLFSFPAVDSDEKTSVLLARHLRAYQVRPRHVTLVLPRHPAVLRRRRYDRILSEAGILPERVILNTQGLMGICQDGVDVMSEDLRKALLSRQRHVAWRRRVMILWVGISCWCILMLGSIRDEEDQARRMAEVLSGHKAMVTELLRQEARAALSQDLIRSQEWQRRLGVVIGALPVSITLTQMRLGLDGSLDLTGQAKYVDGLMAYIDILKKDGPFLHVSWQITGVSKEGMTLFRVQTKRS